jgi:hypothetical protein
VARAAAQTRRIDFDFVSFFAYTILAFLFHARAGDFNFSTHFHSLGKPITPRPTPSNSLTSARLIRIRTKYIRVLLTIINVHAVMICECEALSLPDDPIVSAPPLCPPRLRVIFLPIFFFLC